MTAHEGTTEQAAGTFLGRSGGTFDTYDDGRRSPLMHWIDRRHRFDLFERFALTFERLGDLTGKRGLDIGCGSGPYMAEVIRRGASHVLGLDPALGMLELARQRMEKLGQSDKAEFATGYFPEVTPTGPFDFAIAMGVLDYVADPVPFLESLRTVLTGKAAVSFPSEHWFLAPLRKFRYRLRNCPVYFYNERSIRAIGERAGFRTVDILKIDGAGNDFLVCLQP